jgi:uncharacterized protein YdaL
MVDDHQACADACVAFCKIIEQLQALWPCDDCRGGDMTKVYANSITFQKICNAMLVIKTCTWCHKRTITFILSKMPTECKKKLWIYRLAIV